MPLDMTIETDSKCSDYKVSLVLDPKLVKLLGKKTKDFKSFAFEGKKFEYDADEAPLDDYGDEDFDYGDEGDEASEDDDYYRRRLQYDQDVTFTETNKGFYSAFANNGVGVAGCMNRNSLGSSTSDYANDKYTKTGFESYYVSDTGENYYKEYSYEYSNYDPSKALDAQTTGTTGETVSLEEGCKTLKTRACKEPECWSLYDQGFTETYYHPSISEISADSPCSAEVQSSESSVEYNKQTFPAPEGCTYTIPTKTIDEMLFTNNQLEFTSNFKEKASKQAVYKIKVE